MDRIPRTPAEFERMEFMLQKEVKSKLMQSIYSDLCSAINPEDILMFAPVLHDGDQERLALSRNRNTRASVISDLLSIIKKSLRRKPAWWELLDKVLLKLPDDSLYYQMNPWLEVNRRQPVGGAAYNDGHGGGGGKGGPQCPPSPLPHALSPTRPPIPQPPFPKGLPLADTRRIPEQLSKLCDNERQWRDLAAHLGLTQRDILEIREGTEGGRGNVIADRLIEHLITNFGNQATVGMLIEALLGMNKCGREVVKLMQDQGLIQPPEGEEGSAAGGGGGREGGIRNMDAVEAGSTSSQASVAPPLVRSSLPEPRHVCSRDGTSGGQFHLGLNTHTAEVSTLPIVSQSQQNILPHGTTGTADLSQPSPINLIGNTGTQTQPNPSAICTNEVNLSGKEPIKKTPHPALYDLCYEPEVLRRSISGSPLHQEESMGQNSKPVQRTCSTPATASSVNSNKAVHSNSSSTASIDDNSLYQPTAGHVDSYGATTDQLPREDKVLNISQLSQGSSEEAMNQQVCADSGEANASDRETNLQGRSLQTDPPCDGPDGSASQDMNGMSQDQQSGGDGSQNRGTTVNYIYIREASCVQLGIENKTITASQGQEDLARREENCSEPVAQQKIPGDEECQFPLPIAVGEPEEESPPFPGQNNENSAAVACEENLQPRGTFSQENPPAVSRSLQTASTEPSPFDYEAHQTAVKQLQVIGSNEEEERVEGEQDGQEEEMRDEQRSTEECHPLSDAALPQVYGQQTDRSCDVVDLKAEKLSELGIRGLNEEVSMAHGELHDERAAVMAVRNGEMCENGGDPHYNAVEIPESPQLPHSEQEMPAPLQQQQQVLEAAPRGGVLTRVFSSIIETYLSLE